MINDRFPVSLLGTFPVSRLCSVLAGGAGGAGGFVGDVMRRVTPAKV